MKTIEIKKCNCKGTNASDFQDKKYGKGNRVHNINFKRTHVTCTVCNTKTVFKNE